MSHLEDIEDDFVSKLGTDVTGVKVQSFPDSPDSYQLTHPGGAVLVRYLGSDYSSPEPNRQLKLVQSRVHEWGITILQRSLKRTDAHHGVYTLVESVRNSLSGYTITGLSNATILYPIRDAFVSESEGLWQYEIVFGFAEPATEDD